MLDNIPTSNTSFQAFMSIVTGGAFVGWYRERRMSKKDERKFTLDFMKTQSERIDTLVSEVAELKAANRVSTGELENSRQELARVRAELLVEKAQVRELEHEVVRLKTALGEHGRNAA